MRSQSTGTGAGLTAWRQRAGLPPTSGESSFFTPPRAAGLPLVDSPLLRRSAPTLRAPSRGGHLRADRAADLIRGGGP